MIFNGIVDQVQAYKLNRTQMTHFRNKLSQNENERQKLQNRQNGAMKSELVMNIGVNCIFLANRVLPLTTGTSDHKKMNLAKVC